MAQNSQYLFSVKKRTEKERGFVSFIHIKGSTSAAAESKCYPTVSRFDSRGVWKITQVISMISIQPENYLTRINNQSKASKKCM